MKTPKQASSLLKKAGWKSRQGKGSHVIFLCPCGCHVVVLGVNCRKKVQGGPSSTVRKMARNMKKAGCPHVPDALVS